VIHSFLIYSYLTLVPAFSPTWGFFAHQKINFNAVFTLPEEMIGFFKFHIDYITSEAVKADKRRYTVKGEAPRHYLDVELYPDPIDSLPMYYPDAVARYSKDSIQAWGSVPWTILQVKYNLTEAMRKKDEEAVLRYAADLGHYIADAHVPLHTTVNYNGQLTGQKGIHRFWESRLPELFFEDYDLFTGRAEYIEKPGELVRTIIKESHSALDSVLRIERSLSEKVRESEKFAYVERGNRMVKEYSRFFSEKYHAALDGMVERRLRKSIKRVGDFWYSCWIDAGQPVLEPAGRKDPKPVNIEMEPERAHDH